MAAEFNTSGTTTIKLHMTRRTATGGEDVTQSFDTFPLYSCGSGFTTSFIALSSSTIFFPALSCPASKCSATILLGVLPNRYSRLKRSDFGALKDHQHFHLLGLTCILYIMSHRFRKDTYIPSRIIERIQGYEHSLR